MSLAILISSSPYAHGGCLSALRFCQAAVAKQISIGCIFFYGDAVLLVHQSHPALTAGASASLVEQWQNWAEQNQLPLQVCSAAASRNGLANLQAPFVLGGLGEWISKLSQTQRLIQFR